LLLAYLLAFSAFGQSGKGTISGKIADVNNQSLIGATVRVAGTQLGAATDSEGKFEIKFAPFAEDF
jgi:hypothetical protein